MRKFLFPLLILASALAGYAQKNENFGKGFYRISYFNVHGCKTELQSFDSTITDKKLDNLRSFLHRFGAKDRGLEIEFPTYRVYDFTKRANTEKMLANYSKQQIKEFEKTINKLKSSPIEKEFQTFRDEIVLNYSKRIQFEKIMSEWYVSQNDKVLRKKVLAFYSDPYMIATLDKTLALKGVDKLCYTYNELYDIVFSRVFGYDRIIFLQNKLLLEYKIEVEVDICNKS